MCKLQDYSNPQVYGQWDIEQSFWPKNGQRAKFKPHHHPGTLPTIPLLWEWGCTCNNSVEMRRTRLAFCFYSPVSWFGRRLQTSSLAGWTYLRKSALMIGCPVKAGPKTADSGSDGFVPLTEPASEYTCGVHSEASTGKQNVDWGPLNALLKAGNSVVDRYAIKFFELSSDRHLPTQYVSSSPFPLTCEHQRTRALIVRWHRKERRLHTLVKLCNLHI